jgi:hypothetical protein
MNMEEALTKAVLIGLLTTVLWWVNVVNGESTIEDLFTSVLIGVGIGFAINLLIALFSPQPLS